MKRFRITTAGVVVAVPVLLLVLVAIFAPILWGDRAEATDIYDVNAASSAEHPLGTDSLGRDVLARVVVATRLSLSLAVLAAGLGALLGCTIGIGLALLRGRLRDVGMRIIDALLAFPSILVAILITAVTGPSPRGAVIAVGVSSAPVFARFACMLVISQLGQEYVANARVVGVGPGRLIRRYILPSVGAPLAILAATEVGLSLVALSSISFLGLGVQLPQYDWGRLLVEGVATISVTPGLALGPAFAIAFAGLAFSFAGEYAAAKINPELRRFRRPRTDPWSGRRAVAEPVGTKGDILVVEGLSVAFPTESGEWTRPVRDISLRIGAGEVVGLVGESGSGKSLTAMAVAQLIEEPGRVHADRLELDGVDLLADGPARQRALRRMSVVFQDPMSALNPTIRIGPQLTETRRVLLRERASRAAEAAVRRLREVRVSSPERRLRQRQHELSGGMRQRAVIAMGLMTEPDLLIADEPTTALDVTVQARLLQLLRDLNRTEHTAVLLISHDIGVIAEVCTRVLVMREGRVVEDAPIETFLSAPRHEYSKMLLASVPRLDAPARVGQVGDE